MLKLRAKGGKRWGYCHHCHHYLQQAGGLMAKRFTHTGKWDKKWFRKLGPAEKCLWIFLCDRCSHAGLWDIDEDNFKHFVGFPFTVNDCLGIFGDRVELVGNDKLFVRGFVEFQYGTLNPANRVHKSVIDILKKVSPNKDLTSPLEGRKDKDKEEDKDKTKDKDKEPEITNLEDLFFHIPIVTKEKWGRDYPDWSWVAEQIELAFDFHTADPAQCPRTTGQWMRKLHTWLNNASQKIPNKPTLDSVDLSETEKVGM